MPSPRRVFRFSQAVHARQLDLMIALDRVHDRHNVSAIMRTADAVGIHRLIWSPDLTDKAELNPEVAQGADQWVEVKTVRKLEPALRRYQRQGYRLAATHLGASAVDYREIPWDQPWILIMGNERRGVADDILQAADANIFLPMKGLIQSLNVSVATAIILYEIQRQRQLKGMYDRTLPRKDVRKLFQAWGLAERGFALSDVLTPPPPGSVCPPETHVDGRTSFAEKLRERHRQKSKNTDPSA
jgi:tRNA (guanosine-2'-O-)-methyltransferase